MNEDKVMTFQIKAHRVDSAGSIVDCKQTQMNIDTSMAGRQDAMNPMELLLASLAACLLKGIERIAPTLNFEYSGAEVSYVAHRPEQEALVSDIHYELILETEENDARLELLHKNLQKFGTIYNTVKMGTKLTGTIARANV